MAFIPGTGTAYFTASENFDYRQYLEQRNHFEPLYLAIDRQTAEMIGGLERLIASGSSKGTAHRSNSLEETNRAIRDGFSQIDHSLSDIAGITSRVSDDLFAIQINTSALLEETQKLTPLLEWGFSTTLHELSTANESLDRIAYAVENKDQSWAYSQYKIAQKALLDSKLVPEAFDYVTRAIEGYKGRIGYPLEPNFYLLRGAIRLGVLDCLDLDFIDVDQAIADFEKAARYSQKIDKAIYAKSIAYLGRAHYCKKQLENSIAYFRLAESISPDDGEIKFNLAKSLMASDEKAVAIKSYAEAIRKDLFFAVRAAADKDFLSAKQDCLDELYKFRKELAGTLRILCNTVDLATLKILIEGTRGYSSALLPNHWTRDERTTSRGPGKSIDIRNRARDLVQRIMELCPKLESADIADLVATKNSLGHSGLSGIVNLLEHDRDDARRRSDEYTDELKRRASTEATQAMDEIDSKYRSTKMESEKSEVLRHFIMIGLIILVFLIFLTQVELSWRLIYQVPLAWFGSMLVVGVPSVALIWLSEREQTKAEHREREAVKRATEGRIGKVESEVRGSSKEHLKTYDDVLSQLRMAIRKLQLSEK